MEILLNLTWMALSTIIMVLWLVHSPRRNRGWQGQAVALVMLMLILFPVISVSDDLQVAQNLAEEDSYMRRVDAEIGHLSHLLAVALMPPSTQTEISFVYLYFHGLGKFDLPILQNFVLPTIQNRPPPIV